MNKLGIVTCYFNPCGYRKKLENYYKFREGILNDQIQLLTVELAFHDKPFELTGDVLQLRSNSVMWHKERLLNIGIERLIEDGYEKIVWCDADMMFVQDSGWTGCILRKLDSCSLIQCFDFAEQQFSDRSCGQMGLLCALECGKVTKDNYFGNIMGGCWGITAEMYARIGKLYDYYIIGGGDVAFATGVVSHCLDVDPCGLLTYRQNWMSQHTCNDFKRWLMRFRLALSGHKIGYVPISALFLSHGKTTDRQYSDRYKLIENFDYTLDLLENKDKVFEWGTPRKEMHDTVKKYFEDRKEDD